ncbi:MAG: cadherin-like domain-containing protein, partial [Caldilineaceae bacterium]|nr:cadherin-like domain-containing protein [Caldilineaceae bacterium]
LATGADSWRALTLDQPNGSFTGWSYTINDLVEAPRQLDLTLIANGGITNTVGPLWGGLIDTVPPRVVAAASFDTANGQVSVQCSADDGYLVMNSWACTLPDAPTPTYETASWYVNTFSDTQHVVGLSAGLASVPLQNVTVQACDTVGQCSSDLIEMPGDGGLATIPEIGEYALVYQLDIPVDANYSAAQPAYTVDRSGQIGAFDRVAYYLELDNGTQRQWVYVSMDAFTNNPTHIGVPVASVFEQNVSNVTVLSNVPGITTGGPYASGNIEFWNNCYTPDANSGLGGSGTSFDFDDTVTGANCYGSMQIHRALAGGGGETYFAWNRWALGGSNDDIGIGTSSGTHPDWTFAVNSGNWLTRTLTVLARPVGAAVDDSYTVTPGQPLVVNAPGLLGNDNNVINATLVVSPTRGTVTLQPDGSFVYTLTQLGQNDSFTYQVSDGHYLEATATVNLTLDTATCFVETTGDDVTDAVSADGSALQNAVQAASPGATIKVAGNCAGPLVDGSVLTIDKTLTIDGGHLPTDWLAPSQPITNQATIDGLGAGVVISITTSGDLTARGLLVTDGAGSGNLSGGGIRNRGRLALGDSVVQNNTKSGYYGGGGIYNTGWLSLTNVLVDANSAAFGAGILNLNGTMWIDQSAIIGNSGGGIYSETYLGPTAVLTMTNAVIRNNTANPGLENRGVALVERSAIVNNEADYATGGIENRGVITVTNSTISGNRTLSSAPDGASGFYNDTHATIRNSTIVSNTAPQNAGIAGVTYELRASNSNDAMTVAGTVVAYNGVLDCRGEYFLGFDQTPNTINDFLPAGSDNLASDSSCNFPAADPLLAALANPNAHDATAIAHIPSGDSPLIDAIAPGSAGCGTTVITDQRDVVRNDAGCDIGAVEATIADVQQMSRAVSQGNSYTFG